MSKYTTGEAAKLCGVSVRTVQYYDTRGILIPSELSEGGRRLYSETDIQRLRVICFLRDLGLSINNIGTLFEEENTENVIEALLDEQEKLLRAELAERQTSLDKLMTLRRELKEVDRFSVESIGDIANIMKTKSKLNKLRWQMVLFGLPIEVMEVGFIILGAMTGIWWPMIIWLAAAIAYGVWSIKAYHKKVNYICPDCHHVFKPSMKEIFWASHTPKTRKLRCPNCGKKSYCIEVYDETADAE